MTRSESEPLSIVRTADVYRALAYLTQDDDCRRIPNLVGHIKTPNETIINPYISLKGVDKSTTTIQRIASNMFAITDEYPPAADEGQCTTAIGSTYRFDRSGVLFAIEGSNREERPIEDGSPEMAAHFERFIDYVNKEQRTPVAVRNAKKFATSLGRMLIEGFSAMRDSV